MPDSIFEKNSRRDFLKTSAATAAGFTLGFILPAAAWGQSTGRAKAADVAGAAAGGWQPNAFVRVNADDTVVVIVKHL